MYCIIKCIVQGKQARVKNAHLRHPSCTVVMQRKSASPVLNVLKCKYIFPHHIFYLGDQIKKNEMAWACSTYAGEKSRMQGLIVET